MTNPNYKIVQFETETEMTYYVLQKATSGTWWYAWLKTENIEGKEVKSIRTSLFKNKAGMTDIKECYRVLTKLTGRYHNKSVADRTTTWEFEA